MKNSEFAKKAQIPNCAMWGCTEKLFTTSGSGKPRLWHSTTFLTQSKFLPSPPLSNISWRQLLPLPCLPNSSSDSRFFTQAIFTCVHLYPSSCATSMLSTKTLQMEQKQWANLWTCVFMLHRQWFQSLCDEWHWKSTVPVCWRVWRRFPTAPPWSEWAVSLTDLHSPSVYSALRSSPDNTHIMKNYKPCLKTHNSHTPF